MVTVVLFNCNKTDSHNNGHNSRKNPNGNKTSSHNNSNNGDTKALNPKLGALNVNSIHPKPFVLALQFTEDVGHLATALRCCNGSRVPRAEHHEILALHVDEGAV